MAGSQSVQRSLPFSALYAETKSCGSARLFQTGPAAQEVQWKHRQSCWLANRLNTHTHTSVRSVHFRFSGCCCAARHCVCRSLSRARSCSPVRCPLCVRLPLVYILSNFLFLSGRRRRRQSNRSMVQLCAWRTTIIARGGRALCSPASPPVTMISMVV